MPNIVLGISSSIAAFKVIDLVKKLKGNCVDIIMTKNSTKIISPKEFEKITKKKVAIQGFRKDFNYKKYMNDKKSIEHISLADKADILIVVPATANVIGKIANGIADDLLTTTVIASEAQVLICPAMNVHMWQNPIVKENVSKLRELGYYFVEPEDGMLACGYEGKGRLAAIDKIYSEIENIIENKNKLKGRKIIVTAGGTSEDIDEVRTITNKSSGKMGIAIATEAYKQGAEVLLLKGKNSVESNMPFIEFKSVNDLFDKIKKNIKEYDTIFHAAAVSDFTIDKKQGKIKSSKSVNLKLKPTIKIIDQIKKLNSDIKLIGFKLESGDLVEKAYKKLKQSKADYIIANSTKVIGKDITKIYLIDKNKKIINLIGSKKEVARKLIENVSD